MNAENLVNRIDNAFKTGTRVLVATGLLYAGVLAITYCVADSIRTNVKKQEPVAELDFSHFYNPFRFWQDNNSLVKKSIEIDEKNPYRPKVPLFPGTG